MQSSFADDGRGKVRRRGRGRSRRKAAWRSSYIGKRARTISWIDLLSRIVAPFNSNALRGDKE
jgi:hypothetical protein